MTVPLLRRATGRLGSRARKLKRLTVRGEAVPTSRPTLDEIGLRTGTDKSSAIHDYLGAYDTAFAHLRDEPIQLVEIGVHRAASLQMWEEYFPRAQLVGVDISPDCRQYATDRITVLIGDQSKPAFLNRLARKLRPMIVIDDGSHVWRHQIETLRTLLPVVRPGGFYVVEDIHTSFGADYRKVYGRDRSTETAFDYVQRIARAVTGGSRAGAVYDDFIAHCRQTVESVQFIRNAAILRKRSFPQRKYRVRSVVDLAEQPRIEPAGDSYARIQTELVGASKEVLTAFRRLFGDGTVTVAPAVSGELTQARVVGSGVTTVGHSIVDETLNCVRIAGRGSRLYQVVRDAVWVDERPYPVDHHVPAVEGKRHVLLKQTWDANYGHWMIDTLPKVGLLAKFEDVSRCLFVLNEQVDPQMRRVVEESLSLFGITSDQLMFLSKDSYQFERLTVLGSLTRHPVSKTPLAVEILEGLARVVPLTDGPRRLYVTRASSPRRRLVNEAAVIQVLNAHGYETVEPQTLTVSEQIATFRAAEQIVGVMGAALANVAFAPRGVSVLALATPAMKHDYFYDLLCLKEGRYRGLQGVAAGPDESLASDFTVDLDRLDQALAWLDTGV